MGLFNFLKKDDTKKADKKENIIKDNNSSIEIKVDVKVVPNEIKSEQPPEPKVITIEERTEGTDPVCDGLYPHEVLVLSYATRFHTANNIFQVFWWYNYGISDVQQILDSLAERGYTQIGNISDAIKLETVPSIKEELKERNLKVTGKKDDLVQRLLDNIPEEELVEHFSVRPYKLTPLGEGILKKYEYIPYIHRHGAHGFGDLNIWNLTELVQQDPDHRNYRDVIWDYLNQRAGKYLEEGNYSSYRGCIFEMSEFLAEENRWEDSFNLLCEVSDYDINGACESSLLTTPEEMAKYYFPYERSWLKMAPGITNRIANCQQKLGWDDDTLKEKLLTEFSTINIPSRIFPDATCVEIILDELHEDKDNLERIYDTAEKRFKKTYNIK